MAIAENEAIKIRDAEEGKSPTVFQAIFGDISQYASQFSRRCMPTIRYPTMK